MIQNLETQSGGGNSFSLGFHAFESVDTVGNGQCPLTGNLNGSAVCRLFR